LTLLSLKEKKKKILFPSWHLPLVNNITRLLLPQKKEKKKRKKNSPSSSGFNLEDQLWSHEITPFHFID
jgi:hypothetical protein